eukprot:gene1897-1153_t
MRTALEAFGLSVTPYVPECTFSAPTTPYLVVERRSEGPDLPRSEGMYDFVIGALPQPDIVSDNGGIPHTTLAVEPLNTTFGLYALRQAVATVDDSARGLPALQRAGAASRTHHLRLTPTRRVAAARANKVSHQIRQVGYRYGQRHRSSNEERSQSAPEHAGLGVVTPEELVLLLLLEASLRVATLYGLRDVAQQNAALGAGICTPLNAWINHNTPHQRDRDRSITILEFNRQEAPLF